MAGGNRIIYAQLGSLSFFLINTILLCCWHFARARNDEGKTHNVNDDATALFSKPQLLLFGCLVIMAFELLDFISKNSGKWMHAKTIPVRGKHLDDFRTVDYMCVGFAKANTAPFAYFYLQYCWNYAIWDLSRLTLFNAVLPLPVLFILFDSTYATMHWILHFQCLYGLIHKHHHIQKAPSRANVDAVNVHPVEFFLGEYNHLLVVYFYTQYVADLHAVGGLLFLAVGGLLAGFNHTRHDIEISIPLSKHRKLVLFDSKAHDVHHRIPQSNYGQYSMFWDYLFGSYRPYNPNDRINQDAQLDPRTGKTLQRLTKKGL